MGFGSISSQVKRRTRKLCALHCLFHICSSAEFRRLRVGKSCKNQVRFFEGIIESISYYMLRLRPAKSCKFASSSWMGQEIVSPRSELSICGLLVSSNRFLWELLRYRGTLNCFLQHCSFVESSGFSFSVSWGAFEKTLILRNPSWRLGGAAVVFRLQGLFSQRCFANLMKHDRGCQELLFAKMGIFFTDLYCSGTHPF